MMKSLMVICVVVFPTVANAQIAMTTENRSLGPGTYEESMAQIKGASPPSDGYRKGWQSSVPGVSGGAGTPLIPNSDMEDMQEDQ